MSDLGKAIYMAASAFLFIIAASTSIYAYGTLNAYLKTSTTNINVTNRVETVATTDVDKNREITCAEIYIMIYNMDQMHIDSVTVKGHDTIKKEDMKSGSLYSENSELSHFLKNNPSAKFSYSYSYNSSGGVDVTYEKL